MSESDLLTESALDGEAGWVSIEGYSGVCITKEELTAALIDNFKLKLGSTPVEGQIDDLWRRLTQRD